MSYSEIGDLSGKIVGVIPARWASSRFPGKPLASVYGKTLIQRTYEQAIQASLLDKVIVATDDPRIYESVCEFGGLCVMTDISHSSGTVRVAEVAEKYCDNAEIIVNIQGDEPCLSPEVIDGLIRSLTENPQADVMTPVFLSSDYLKIYGQNRAKCVFNEEGKALYFSRQPLPSVKQNNCLLYYVHVGIYCFRKEFLLDISKKATTSLAIAEDLEQLSFLQYGNVHVFITSHDSPAVDYPEDIKVVEEILSCPLNVSL